MCITRVLVFTLLWINCVKANDRDPLFLEWKRLSNLQLNQTALFGKEFPVDDRLYVNLGKCGVAESAKSNSVHSLRVQDIEIYAEVGHGTTFCRPGIALLRYPNDTVDLERDVQVFRHQCLNSMQTQSQNPSLAKIMRLSGANLEVFESNVAHQSLQSWSRHVIRMIRKTSGWQNKWKFILIGTNLFDIPLGHGYHQLADHILQSIQLLHSELGDKTFVVVVKNAELRIQRDAAADFFFCEQLLNLWHTDRDKAQGAWNTFQLENRIKQNYRSEQFYVQVLDVLDEARPVYYEGRPDMSILESDCSHFSARGLSLLHGHLWNQLVQPGREARWTPLVRPLFCPRPHCPFLETDLNQRECPIPRGLRLREDTSPEYMTLLFMSMSVLLFVVLCLYTVCL